jgi:hypothetical protein
MALKRNKNNINKFTLHRLRQVLSVHIFRPKLLHKIDPRITRAACQHKDQQIAVLHIGECRPTPDNFLDEGPDVSGCCRQSFSQAQRKSDEEINEEPKDPESASHQGQPIKISSYL